MRDCVISASTFAGPPRHGDVRRWEHCELRVRRVSCRRRGEPCSARLSHWAAESQQVEPLATASSLRTHRVIMERGEMSHNH